MFELLSADTPNGKKISIMLEELNLKYKVTKINILKGDQFTPSFSKISPFNKIPVLKDLKSSTSKQIHSNDKISNDWGSNSRRPIGKKI